MSSDSKTNILWGVVVLLAVVALGVVYYKYHDYFTPEAKQVLAYDPECDLKAGACTTELGNGSQVRFEILPATIPLLQPLDLDVQVAQLDVDRIEVDFAGVDMNMGFNRNKLSAAGSGVYKGKATLPVCIRKRMDWEAKVMLYTDDGLIIVPYRFETIK